MKNLLEDKKAKSKSFFLNSKKDFFKKKHINFLIKYYKKRREDVRICLHKNQKDRHHDMIILQQKKKLYRPHKHIKKGETYHIIKGSMACVLFNNKGNITRICKIKKNDIFRTPVNTFHTMAPLSKYVIYHESKTGPFLKKNDSIFSLWSKSLTKKELDIKIKKKLINTNEKI